MSDAQEQRFPSDATGSAVPGSTDAVDHRGPSEPAATDGGKSFGDRAGSWVKRFIGVLVIVALLVIAYFILEAFLPRWWGNFIGSRVKGSFSGGISTGLVLGVVCTFVPLLALSFAVVARGRWKGLPAALFSLVAVVVAIPNLLTLAVVLGRGNGSHAGQRSFDVNAPGFRAATLWGALIAVVLVLIVDYFLWRYRRRGRQLKASRLREKEIASGSPDQSS